MFCVHFIWYWSCTLSFFDHHALKCAIDGPRVEGHTPLSLTHDKEGGCTYIALKMHCHALFILCCSKTGFCRNRWSVDHLHCRPATHSWPRAPFLVDDQFSLAGDHYSWPVTSHSAQGLILEHIRDFCSFQRCRAVQTEATWVWRWISERNRTCTHSSLFPRPLYCFLSLINSFN